MSSSKAGAGARRRGRHHDDEGEPGEEAGERRERGVVAVPPVRLAGRAGSSWVCSVITDTILADPRPGITRPRRWLGHGVSCRGGSPRPRWAPWRFVSSTRAAPTAASRTTWSSCSGTRTGFFWIDVPVWDTDAEALLTGLGCHPMVLEGCRQRNYVPTVHGYEDHVFVTTRPPSSGSPATSTCWSWTRSSATTTWSPCTARSTRTWRRRTRPGRDRRRRGTRLYAGRYLPGDADRAGVRRHVGGRPPTERPDPRDPEGLPGLEKEVMSSRLRTPRPCWRRMFLFRDELITRRTMAAQCHDVWARMAEIGRWPTTPTRYAPRPRRPVRPGPLARRRGVAFPVRRDRALPDQGAHQDDRRHGTARGDRRGDPADHRVASVYGMNVIVNDEDPLLLLAPVLLLVMLDDETRSLLRWARRQGWW